MESIRRETGRVYKNGNTSQVMNRTVSGSSSDYACQVMKIPYVITMELSQHGKTGFHTPQSKILLKAKEYWIGIRAMCLHVVNKAVN